jgi:hypothetical protein
VLIIVLCIVGAFLLLIGGCVVTCAYLVRGKVKEAQKNPTYAALSFAAAMNPDVKVVSKDENTGKITLLNKKTGEKVTINTNDFTPDNIGRALEQVAKGVKPVVESSESKETAAEPAAAPAGGTDTTVETRTEESETPAAPVKTPEKKISPAQAAAQAATMKKFPDFVAAYPGAKTLESTLNSFGENSIGNYTCSTGDDPEKVADFYEKKFTDTGFTILSRQNGSDDNGASVTMVANRTDPQAMITLTANVESGATHVVIGFTRAGGK